MILRSFSALGEQRFASFLDAYQNGDVSQDLATDIALNNTLTEFRQSTSKDRNPAVSHQKRTRKICERFIRC